MGTARTENTFSHVGATHKLNTEEHPEFGAVFFTSRPEFPSIEKLPEAPKHPELRGVVSFFLHGRRFRASTVGMQRFIVRQQQD